MSLAALLVGLAFLGLMIWLYRTGDNSRRVTALKRIFYGVPYFSIMFFVGFIFGIYTICLFVVDSLWTLITGRKGVSPGGRAERLWDWKDRNTRFLMTGNGSFKILP